MNRKWQLIVAGAMLASVIVAPAVEASTYQVQKGDTLTKIAQKHKTTVQNIKKWNRLTDDVIYIDQKLVVASSTNQPAAKPIVNKVIAQKPLSATKVEDEVVKQPSIEPTAHTIRKGDTLTNIAKKYNITVANLKQWNGLQSDVIYLGQTLTVHGEQTSASEATSVPNQGEQTVDDMIAQQLQSEKLLLTKPTALQQERYMAILDLAKQLMGIPYVYGGNTTAGFDCSGFISYVYSSAGFDITRKSSLDYFLSDTTHVKNPVAGDFVFFKNTYIPTISHMGIYLGDDQFIHAGTKGIEIASMNTIYWKERFVAYKRYNGE